MFESRNTMADYKHIRITGKASYYGAWPSDEVVKTTAEMAKRLIADGYAEEVETKKKTTRKRTSKKKEE